MKGVLIALSIVALCAVPVGLQAQAKPKTMNAAGTVKSVEGTSLTITVAGGKEMTFTIDNTTKFVGKGLSTKSSEGPLKATDAVGAHDQVRVAYHDVGGTLHASTVTITGKAPGRK